LQHGLNSGGALPLGADRLTEYTLTIKQTNKGSALGSGLAKINFIKITGEKNVVLFGYEDVS
jgi:predicted Na+-dependent transporter